MRNTLRSLVYAALALTSPMAFGYYSVLDNAELLKDGQYRLLGTGQLLTETGGANLSARIDAGLTEDVGARGIFGFGKTDVFFGGMLRWSPIPDLDDQPAMGANVGVLYAKDSHWRDIVLRFEPLISKRVTYGANVITPYASLPIGLRMRDSDVDNDDDITWQLVVGSQLQIEKWKNLQFIAELGVDLEQSPSYVSAGAILYFDAENGIVIE